MLPSGIRLPLQKLFGSGASLTNAITGNVTGDLTGDVTGNVTGNVTGDVTGDVTGYVTSALPGTLQAAQYGAGGVGSGGFNRCYQRTVNGIIVTTYHIDLTGLSVKGGNADDVIGTGTDPAYIDQYEVGVHGIVFRATMSMIEVGAAASGTITNHICLTGETGGDIDYDEAGGTDQIIDPAAAMVAGATYVNEVPTITADDHLYLTEGDTAAASGVYSAGQLIITLYGHALIT